MPKSLSNLSVEILSSLDHTSLLKKGEIIDKYEQTADNKKVSAALYRLEKANLIAKQANQYFLTEQGKKVIHIKQPTVDSKWNIIIFDIPEKFRSVRNVLRQKLQDLGFKKWQNSIWISPFVIEPSVEQELLLLSSKYFIRLIKTEHINNTEGLSELFPGVDLPKIPTNGQQNSEISH